MQLTLPLPGQVRQCDFVVSVSGGLGSIEALERAILQKGHDHVSAVFADVGSIQRDGKVVCGEDEDLHRFLAAAESYLKHPIHRIKSRQFTDIWDVFFKQRFMGNSQVDPCSKFLKRRVLDAWIESYHPGAVRVVGFSWLEKSRTEKYLGYFPDAWFPLCEPPLLTNEEIAAKWEARGVPVSRSYKLGFAHDNCGGFCVKMGLAQARELWLLRPDRYAFHEEMEERFRVEVNAEATIFSKSDVPITMRALRKLFEVGYVPRGAKESCGGRCMMPGGQD